MFDIVNIINRNIELIYKNHSEMKKIVIWGAGNQGRSIYRFCKNIGVDIDFFVDRYCEVKEDSLLGKKVVSPNYIKLANESNNKVFVLIASNSYDEISKQLASWGFIENIDFISFFNDKHVKRMLVDGDTRKFVDSFYQNEIPLFNLVEIETINRCNMDCQFCPVNKNEDRRDFKLMREELFDSILSQLHELDYDGNLSFHSNNEPFMDKRIIGFVHKARKTLPNANLYLYTNGTLLTLEKFKSIMEALDNIIIDNYSNDYEFIASVKEIYEYCKRDNEISKKVKILKRRTNQQLFTRGGQAPNREKIQMNGITCVFPFTQLIIRPDGKISLCCNDALGVYTLGDLNKERLIDIWHGEIYEDIRQKILDGRENLLLCKNCDMVQEPPSCDGKYKIDDTTDDTLLEVWS